MADLALQTRILRKLLEVRRVHGVGAMFDREGMASALGVNPESVEEEYEELHALGFIRVRTNAGHATIESAGVHALKDLESPRDPPPFQFIGAIHGGSVNLSGTQVNITMDPETLIRRFDDALAKAPVPDSEKAGIRERFMSLVKHPAFVAAVPAIIRAMTGGD